MYARIGTVNLVDDHDGLQLGFKSLGQHVAGLGQRAFGRIHQQHDAVDHLESAFDFAAEIGVAGGVDNVDLATFKGDGGVLGKDGDAAFPFQIVRVHHPVCHLLIGAECSRLPQHGVYEGCLAVVNVGNDGDIAYRLGHRCGFPSLGVWPRVAWGWRCEKRGFTAHCGTFHSIRSQRSNCYRSVTIRFLFPVLRLGK